MKKINKNITEVYSKVKSPFINFIEEEKMINFQDEKLSLEDVGYLSEPFPDSIEKSKVTQGRNGSVVLFTEKTHWSMTLISRVITDIYRYDGKFLKMLAMTDRSKFRNHSFSSSIEILISNIFRSNLFEASLKNSATDIIEQEKNEYILSEARKRLKKIFYVEDEIDGLLELFIPDVTFHIVPLFRYLLLGLLDPKLLNINEFDVIGNLTNLGYIKDDNPFSANFDETLYDPGFIEFNLRENSSFKLDFNKLHKDAKSLTIKKVKNKEELSLALIKNLKKEEIKTFEKKFMKIKEIVSQAGKIQE
tara:strand:- start:44 stop:958 length:915 start_codon:yes stop_codon:yes gene_type:complete